MADQPKSAPESGAIGTQVEAAPSEEIIANLRTQRNFEHMPEEMLRKLLQIMTVAHFDHGSLIMEQGHEFPYTCILLKGRVAIFVDNKHILDLRRTGDVVGEMSFINEGPCTATVKAEAGCDLILISKATLTKIGDTNFYIWLCRVLSDKLKRTTELISKDT